MVSALAVGTTTVLATVAQNDLERAQAETAPLLKQQTEFREASDLETLVAAITAAQQYGASTEVDWAEHIDFLTTTMPAGMQLTDASTTAVAPWQAQAAPAGPLRGVSSASFQLGVSAPSAGAITEWVRGLTVLTGYTDSSIDTVSAGDDAVTATVTLNLDALARSRRYATPAEPAPAEPSTPAASTTEPSTPTGTVVTDITPVDQAGE